MFSKMSLFPMTGSRTFALLALAAAPALAVMALSHTFVLIAPTWFALVAAALFVAVEVSPFPALVRGILFRLLFVAVAAAILLWPALAHAQAATASPTAVSLGGLFSDVRGTIEAVIGAVVLGIVGILAAVFKKSTGLSVDAKMRESLQSAALNGVHLGLDKVQELADKTSIDVKSAIIADGIGYIRRFAPLAVKHFKLGEDDLAAIVRAKLASLQPAETVTTIGAPKGA